MKDVAKNAKSSKKVVNEEPEIKPVINNETKNQNVSEIIVTHILDKIFNIVVKNKDLEEFIALNLNNHIIRNVDNLISTLNEQNFILTDNDIGYVKFKNSNESKENLIKIQNNMDINNKEIEREIIEKTGSMSSNFNNTKFSNLFTKQDAMINDNKNIKDVNKENLEKELIKTGSSIIKKMSSNINENMNIVFNKTEYKNIKFGWNNARIKNKCNNYNYYNCPVSNFN